VEKTWKSEKNESSKVFTVRCIGSIGQPVREYIQNLCQAIISCKSRMFGVYPYPGDLLNRLEHLAGTSRFTMYYSC
jgi:hypothetical protein